MEVALLASTCIPEDAILSVRAGTVRRQVGISSGRPCHFPRIGPEDNPLKLDILQQVATAYLVVKPGEEQYKVTFSGGEQAAGMTCEVEIRPNDGSALVPAEEAADEGEAADSAKDAKDYLESHQIMQFWQALLQAVVKERPADPYAYMARHFMSGYEPLGTKAPGTAPKEKGAPQATASPTVSPTAPALGVVVSAQVPGAAAAPEAQAPEEALQTQRRPHVFAIRHAQSNANVAKEENLESYWKRAWLDDSHLPRERQLRDAALSEAGIAATLERAPMIAAQASLAEDEMILLVVSPLTRAICTAVLGFSQLVSQLGDLDRVAVVVDPCAMELINREHDIIEDVGREMEAVLRECEALLATHVAAFPGMLPGAKALLAKIKDSARAFPPFWWFKPASEGQLPIRVFETEAARRKEAIIRQVTRLVDRCNERGGRTVGEVYIVCHWGVVQTLSGSCNKPMTVDNLARFEVLDFWDVAPEG